MAATAVVLKEGMKISEQELLDQGCRFTANFADTKVFEKGDRLIYWEPETQTIWRNLVSSSPNDVILKAQSS